LAAPQLKQSFGLTPDQIGVFFTASTLGVIAGAILGGRLADRLGRRRLLLPALLLFGLFSIATGFAVDFSSLTAARFLTGLVSGAALPNLIALVAEHSAPTRRNSAVAALYAGLPLGAAMAGLAAGIAASWQWLFFVGGAAPLALLPLFRLTRADMRAAPARKRPAGFVAALAAEGRLLPSLLLWSAFFLALVTTRTLVSWLPLLMIGRGLARTDAALLQTAFQLGAVAGSLATGRVMDLHRHRVGLLTALFGGAALMLALTAAAPVSHVLSLCVGGLLGMTVIGSQSALYGLAPSLYPASLRGTGVGVGLGFGRLGSLAGPLLTAQLLTLGWSPASILQASVPLFALCGLFTILLARRPSSPA
jgi:AAHS family 3-hydroxyphenylpropionic acid transporter